MATIETRRNETTGEKEIIIKDINNDLNGLIDEINKCREEEKQEIKTRKIFITEDIIFNDKFSDNIEIYNCVFEKKVDFSNSVFRKKVKLYKCIFESTTHFNNTTFKNLVDFYGCVFKKPQQFYKTDFNRVTIFSNAIFEQEAQFIYCTTTLLSYISFQSAKFKMGIDVARANFNCKVNFWDIRVEDEGLLEAINSDYYFSDFNLKWLDENRNNKKELAKWTPASKKLRESMRFIKNNFYAENNQIEGLEFYKKEMDVYGEELKNPKEEKKITKPSKKDTKPKCFIEANIQSFFSAIKKKLLSILWSIISWGKNIVTWVKDQKEKYSICYYIIIVFLIILFLSLYVIYQTYWIFWGFAIFYSGTILLEINVKNIKNAIKETNYIPPILFLLANFLLLLSIYGRFDYKNQDEIYGLLMDAKQFLNNCNIWSFIDESWFSIIIYSMISIALFLTIVFDYRDKILLYLNKKSNDFGTNWMAGVNFTILVGLVTYLPFLGYLYYINCIGFDLSSKSIGNFLQNFGELLNPLKWTNDLYIFGMKPTGWFYVLFFIGRIFLGYGYYQTIQAFRKYGKS